MNMALGPRLDLRQGQQLVITPQLQQAIKLLALTNLELESFVAGEMEKNPLLESGESDGDGDGPSETGGGSGAEPGDKPAPDADPSESWEADRLITAGRGDTDSPLDVDYTAETFHHDGPSDSGYGLDGALTLNGGGAAGGASAGPAVDMDLMRADEPSLAEHLLEQASATLHGGDLLIARHLIDLIDEAGYFEGRLEDVAERLGTTLAEAERVLGVIQTFDPTGVGARTLGECLAIQAREVDRLDPAMAKLLKNLDLVAKGGLTQLRRICGVDSEDMADMLRELRSYNPKPGLSVGGGPSTVVVPDIFVSRTRNGWGIELNTATLPKVLVNRGYYVELQKNAQQREARAFLAECLASANWLVKALDQRARTIIKVATELVRQQEAFFERGVHHLRPLNLRAIAEVVGVHESTVSRVTSNKYLSCERGTFELRYFFTSAIQSADGGEAHSALAVKETIRNLIAAEGDDILSDDKLVEVLNADGFDIARRTVAKYREALGIGSSVHRRRMRKLAC